MKYKSRIPHQRSPYAVKFEDRSHWQTERKSDAPAETRGNLPRTSLISEKRKKLHSIRFPLSGVLPVASTMEPEEREFVVDSGASMHMVGKTLTLPNWKTQGPKKSPTTVVIANGEVLTN